MENKIVVNNTETMAVLLDALNIRRYEWIPTNTGIEINISKSELTYAILSSDEVIQHIYGKTLEWQELCKYI